MDDGNLRESLGISASYQEEIDDTQPIRIQLAGKGRLLGMTAPQRFIVALMVFLLTGIIGTLLLVLADKVVLPF
jgi:hypothetical protein